MRIPAAAVLALASFLSLAGCAYQLDGKVVDGFGALRVARAGDPEERKGGIPGAQVELVRDGGTMNRAIAARATTGPDGRFVLDVQGFGAGWMEETWQLRVRRSGYENVDSEVQLPGSPSGRVVIVGMRRGRSAPFHEPETTKSIIDEAKAWDPTIGSKP